MKIEDRACDFRQGLQTHRKIHLFKVVNILVRDIQIFNRKREIVAFIPKYLDDILNIAVLFLL